MSKRRPLPQINITPLIDVLLIVLVIVMLAAPLQVKRLPVDVPVTTGLAGTPTAVKALELSITAEGKVFVDKSPVETKDVALFIKPTTSVELYVEKTTPYETFAAVLAKVEEAKPKEVVLVTR